MIDFLGRRRVCRDLARDDTLPSPRPGSRREWLRCGSLGGEEAALRRRYADNPVAIGFLDQAPEDFRLSYILVNAYHGPPLSPVEQVDQRGPDATGRVTWRVSIDAKAVGGQATSVTASWGEHPPRTIFLPNALFPQLDLASLNVAVEPERRNERLILHMQHGFHRGWCSTLEIDDRAHISITFGPDEVSVYRQDMTNCSSNYEELDTQLFSRPPNEARP